MSVLDFIKRLPAWPWAAKRRSPARKGDADLGSLSAPEFESLLAEAFRGQGYQVMATGGGAADGGASLVLRRDRQTHLVHCKQWRASRVGVEVAQTLHEAMNARGAAGGFIVSSGRFSRDASAFATGCNIRLIEGPALAVMIRRVRAAAPSRPSGPPAPSVR